MRLSIVIPVYNVEKYIAKCLDSLLDQDLDTDDYEVIVIIDGSKDNSLSIVENYAKKHHNIKVFEQENSGVGSARNNGLERAVGKYVYFLDPDDYLAPNVLKTLIETCELNNLDVLTFMSKQTTDRVLYESTTDKNIGSIHRAKDGIDYIANFKYKSAVWWYFVKKDFLNDIGIRYIEGRWMEDAIFTMELFIKAKSIAYLPYDVHRYLVAPGTAMTSKEPSHYLRVIYDNENAAVVFKPIIENIDNTSEINKDCRQRIKSIQQSFVFFMMIRMIKSTINLKEVKPIIERMESIEAYPLNAFLGKDYNSVSYSLLVRLFNNKSLFYFVFRILNPIFRYKHGLKQS